MFRVLDIEFFLGRDHQNAAGIVVLNMNVGRGNDLPR